MTDLDGATKANMKAIVASQMTDKSDTHINKTAITYRNRADTTDIASTHLRETKNMTEKADMTAFLSSEGWPSGFEQLILDSENRVARRFVVVDHTRSTPVRDSSDDIINGSTDSPKGQKM